MHTPRTEPRGTFYVPADGTSDGAYSGDGTQAVAARAPTNCLDSVGATDLREKRSQWVLARYSDPFGGDELIPLAIVDLDSRRVVLLKDGDGDLAKAAAAQSTTELINGGLRRDPKDFGHRTEQALIRSDLLCGLIGEVAESLGSSAAVLEPNDHLQVLGT